MNLLRFSRGVFASVLLPVLVAAQGNVIRNDTVWNDTEGNLVRASMGGHITQIGDTYYWVGNDQENQSNAHLYASKTLGSDSWVPTGTLAQGRVQFLRPNGQNAGGVGSNLTLLRSPTTGNFVIIAKGSGLSFYESETVEGPYIIRNELSRRNPPMNLHTINYKIGGMSTFQEGDKAYVITSRRWLGDPAINPNNQRFTGIYQLTPDFLDVEKEILWLRNDTREAMWLFKRGDTYYMTASHTAGWTPSNSYYRTAPSLSGPWSANDTEIGMNPAPTGRLDRSVGTQQRYIMKVGEQWIFGGDRYPTIEPESYPDSSPGDARMYRICPVIWDGDHPVVQFQSEWTIDAEVSPFNAWANLNFVENGPDKRSGDKTADEDGDGLVNLLEFALGGNPRLADAPDILPSFARTENGISFTFRRRKAVDSGVSYMPQVSSNLLSGSWVDAPELEIGTESLDETFERVTAELSTSTAVFIRLEVSDQ